MKGRISTSPVTKSAATRRIAALGADTCIRRRAERASRGKFLRAMARVPNAKPAKGDEL